MRFYRRAGPLHSRFEAAHDRKLYVHLRRAGCTVVGFENHSGKTYLGDGVKPIGKVLAGYGNNGEDGFEGARYKNVFATYFARLLCFKIRRLRTLC